MVEESNNPNNKNYKSSAYLATGSWNAKQVKKV